MMCVHFFSVQTPCTKPKDKCHKITVERNRLSAKLFYTDIFAIRFDFKRSQVKEYMSKANI